MKILFNTYPFAFQSPGGGELIILKLKKALEENGIYVEFFNQWQTKVVNYDIVHHFATLDYPVFLNYKRAQRPIVLTPTLWLYDSKFSIFKYRIKRFIKKIFQRKLFDLGDALNLADLILPTTSIEMNRIKNFYGTNSKMSVVPNAVDLPQNANTESFIAKELGLEKYILFVGNISKIKNLHTLIKVCENNQIPIVVVGDKKDDSVEYYNQCKSLAGPNIYFIGTLENNSQALNDLYYHSHFVVIPSEFETCSLVGLEAGIRGKDVVITKNGGTKEVFKDYVTYIDPFDENEISNIITKKFNQPQKINSQLEEYIRKNYTWDAVAKMVIEHYRRLLA